MAYIAIGETGNKLDYINQKYILRVARFLDKKLGNSQATIFRSQRP
jgi:hypothetical protein